MSGRAEALELRDKISRFYYERHYYINRDTFYACMNTIKPWINMSVLVTYLMKHGLVNSGDEMNKVTSSFLDRTTKLNNLLCLTENNGGRDGYFILYKCFCESRGEVPLGHGDVIVELERHAAANPKIPEWLEQQGQIGTSWNPNSLPSHWTTGTDEQGGQSLRSQDISQLGPHLSNNSQQQASPHHPHSSQAGPHHPLSSQAGPHHPHSSQARHNLQASQCHLLANMNSGLSSSTAHSGTYSGFPSANLPVPIEETTDIFIETTLRQDSTLEAPTPRRDSPIQGSQVSHSEASRFQGGDDERDIPGQGQMTQVAASDEHRGLISEVQKLHMEEHSTASDSLSSYTAPDSVFSGSIQNTSSLVHGDDVPQGQSMPNQTQSLLDSVPQQQSKTTSDSLQSLQPQATLQSKPPPSAPTQTQHLHPSQLPDKTVAPPTVHYSHRLPPASNLPCKVTTDERHGCTAARGGEDETASQISSVKTLIVSGDVHTLCTKSKDMIDVECMSVSNCSDKASFMGEVSKFVCAVLNSRASCHLGVLLGGVSYNTAIRSYEVVGISMSEDELSLVKNRLLQVLSLSLTCASSGKKVVGVDSLVQFECHSVQTSKGHKTVVVVYVTPKCDLCKATVYQHRCHQSSSESICYCRVKGTTIAVKPHDVQELESKIRNLWEEQCHN